MQDDSTTPPPSPIPDELLATLEEWRTTRRALVAAQAHLEEVRRLPLEGTRLSDAYRAVDEGEQRERDLMYHAGRLLEELATPLAWAPR